MKLAISVRRNLIHKVVRIAGKAYYKCNLAVGSLPESRLYTPEMISGVKNRKCMNCWREGEAK